jgi:hypothetical protein
MGETRAAARAAANSGSVSISETIRGRRMFHSPAAALIADADFTAGFDVSRGRAICNRGFEDVFAPIGDIERGGFAVSTFGGKLYPLAKSRLQLTLPLMSCSPLS